MGKGKGKCLASHISGRGSNTKITYGERSKGYFHSGLKKTDKTKDVDFMKSLKLQKLVFIRPVIYAAMMVGKEDFSETEDNNFYENIGM